MNAKLQLLTNQPVLIIFIFIKKQRYSLPLPCSFLTNYILSGKQIKEGITPERQHRLSRKRERESFPQQATPLPRSYQPTIFHPARGKCCPNTLSPMDEGGIFIQSIQAGITPVRAFGWRVYCGVVRMRVWAGCFDIKLRFPELVREWPYGHSGHFSQARAPERSRYFIP